MNRPDAAPSPALPLLGWRGSALQFFRNPIAFMVDLQRRFGNVACLAPREHPSLFCDSATPAQTFFAFGAACNQHILNHVEIFQSRRPRGPKTDAYQRLSDNILFMNGRRHQQQRRLLLPAFDRKHLQAYYRQMVDHASRTFDQWPAGHTIDAFEDVSKLTMDLASKVFFGLEPIAGSQGLAQTMRTAINTLFSPASMIPIDLPGTPFRRLRQRLEAIERQLRAEILRKRQDRKITNDVLSLMIAAHDDDGTTLTEDELISQAFVLFFTGHDTSSCALCWTLFLLAAHPEVAHALSDELRARLGEDPPSYQQLFELPVLDRVLKESLRLLPPAVMFPRTAARETSLEGFTIPVDSDVVYSPYITHLDPDVFERPRTFDPDRWQRVNPSPFAYLPFGHGARKCLGASFASMQLRLLVAMMLQRFRPALVAGTRIDVKVNVVMRPKRPLPLSLQPLDRHRGTEAPAVGGFIRTMVDLEPA